LINLYGIESPGLTASMPLADEVVHRLTERREIAVGEQADVEGSR
jgi:L-2-hydroxyglutarate oxidase LhgO